MCGNLKLDLVASFFFFFKFSIIKQILKMLRKYKININAFLSFQFTRLSITTYCIAAPFGFPSDKFVIHSVNIFDHN